MFKLCLYLIFIGGIEVGGGIWELGLGGYDWDDTIVYSAILDTTYGS
jgi:hypothetical protein